MSRWSSFLRNLSGWKKVCSFVVALYFCHLNFFLYSTLQLLFCYICTCVISGSCFSLGDIIIIIIIILIVTFIASEMLEKERVSWSADEEVGWHHTMIAASTTWTASFSALCSLLMVDSWTAFTNALQHHVIAGFPVVYSRLIYTSCFIKAWSYLEAVAVKTGDGTCYWLTRIMWPNFHGQCSLVHISAT